MSDKGHKEFIEHVCESFEDDDEVALVARDQISSIVNESDAELLHANRELTSGFFSSGKNRMLITLFLLISSFVMIAYHLRDVSKLNVFSIDDFIFGEEYTSLADQYPQLSAEEKFTLFGDPEAKNHFEVAQSRWRRSPGNVGYYLEYALEYHAQNEEYPEDMIEVGDEIDSENSVYRLCVVGRSVRDEVVMNEKHIDPYENETYEERRARTLKEREERKNRKNRKSRKEEPQLIVPAPVKLTEPRMVIRDKERFDDSLQLLFEASKKKVFSDHTCSLMKERIPLLNTDRKTLSDHMIPFLYMAQTKSAIFPVMRSYNIIITEAQRCGREKDIDALKKLMEAHESIARQLTAEDNVTLLQALVARSYISIVLPHFKDAAIACDLPVLEKKYTDLIDAFEREEVRREAAPISPQAIDARKYGSVITSVASPLIMDKIRDQSVVTPADHEPLRKAEHAIFSRVAVACSWLIFVVLASLFHLSNKFKNKPIQRISKKLLGVLGKKDWLLVLLLGIVIPALLFYLVDRYSPWRIIAYNVAYMEGLHSVLRAVILVILLLCSQVLVLEWRLAKMTDRVFGKQNVWLVWVALILALVPLFMLNVIAESSDPLKWYAMLGMSLFILICFVFLRFLPGLFSYKNSILSRAMVMSLVMTATILTLLLPVYQAEERYWIVKDEVMKLSPNRASFSRLEGEVTTQFVKETRELMGWE